MRKSEKEKEKGRMDRAGTRSKVSEAGHLGSNANDVDLDQSDVISDLISSNENQRYKLWG